MLSHSPAPLHCDYSKTQELRYLHQLSCLCGFLSGKNWTACEQLWLIEVAIVGVCFRIVSVSDSTIDGVVIGLGTFAWGKITTGKVFAGDCDYDGYVDVGAFAGEEVLLLEVHFGCRNC